MHMEFYTWNTSFVRSPRPLCLPEILTISHMLTQLSKWGSGCGACKVRDLEVMGLVTYGFGALRRPSSGAPGGGGVACKLALGRCTEGPSTHIAHTTRKALGPSFKAQSPHKL